MFRKLFIFIILWSPLVNAGIDLKATERLVIPVDTVTPKITSEDIAKIIPLDLSQGDSERTVFTKIADKSVSYLINSSAMNETSVGRLARTTQEKLKADLVFLSTKSNEISHKITFKVEAFQALAQMEYSGWLKAVFNYDLKSATSDLVVHEKVFSDKDLTFSHRANREQAISMVGLAWTW